MHKLVFELFAGVCEFCLSQSKNVCIPILFRFVWELCEIHILSVGFTVITEILLLLPNQRLNITSVFEFAENSFCNIVWLPNNNALHFRDRFHTFFWLPVICFWPADVVLVRRIGDYFIQSFYERSSFYCFCFHFHKLLSRLCSPEEKSILNSTYLNNCLEFAKRKATLKSTATKKVVKEKSIVCPAITEDNSIMLSSG